jgi:DNA-directed RNA polymerase specialized sigma24 family protein
MQNRLRSLLTSAQGAEEVTREQFAVLWQEFWQSDDSSAPGNYIFGKTTF